MKWFYILVRSIAWLYCSIAFKVTYEGIENIPQRDEGYILASNHASNLDPVVLSMKFDCWIRYLAKAELVKYPALAWFFRSLGIVSVDRGQGDTSAIDRCVELIGEGHVLGIFPEGTRFFKEPGRPKSGMSLIAKRCKADILPCAIEYERPLRFRSGIKVRIGEMIEYKSLGLDEDSPRAIKRATKVVWNEVVAMLGVHTDED